MARRASYSYERSQRDRAKVEKREAKKAARAARKDGTADNQLTPFDGSPLNADAPAPAPAPAQPAAAATPVVEDGAAPNPVS
jgi:hypothetical protein